MQIFERRRTLHGSVTDGITDTETVMFYPYSREHVENGFLDKDTYYKTRIKYAGYQLNNTDLVCSYFAMFQTVTAPIQMPEIKVVIGRKFKTT